MKHQMTCCKQLQWLLTKIIQWCFPGIPLIPVMSSSWMQLLFSWDNHVFITLIDFHDETLECLLALFALVYDKCSPFPYHHGFIAKRLQKYTRSHMIHPQDYLWLVLAWAWTRGLLLALQMMFGMIMCPFYKFWSLLTELSLQSW